MSLSLVSRDSSKEIVVTYKQTKTIQARQNGKIRRGCKPNLEVEDAATNFGPLELFFALQGRADIKTVVSWLEVHIIFVVVSYLNLSGLPSSRYP